MNRTPDLPRGKGAFTWALAGLTMVALMTLPARSPVPAQAQVAGIPTPTVDRLAEPTLPPGAGQADRGAQAYWLHCMACHGDRGQGLTAEFRALYPPEDRNCWTSGCHGTRPYKSGFTLPPSVPALIGPGALARFETAGNVFGFLDAAMPFQAPGSLDSDTYWQVTAFLLRQNGVDLGSEPLSAENAMRVRLRPGLSETTPPDATPSPTQTRQLNKETRPGDQAHPLDGRFPLIPLAILVIVAVLGGGVALYLGRSGQPQG